MCATLTAAACGVAPLAQRSPVGQTCKNLIQIGDGQVNFGDINPFVLYLSNNVAWQATYPGCPPENGDVSGDGSYPSFDDINPFVALLSGGGA
jgi:hypothetical protein